MKIAILCPDAPTVWLLYKGLLGALKKNGADVYVISEPGVYVNEMQQIGIIHIPIHIKRFISPLADLRLLYQLYVICRTYQFDFVHCFFLKLNLYGAIAAKLAGVKKVFGTVEGLGATYTEAFGIRKKLLAVIMDRLNRLAYSLAERVWFVNKDDFNELVHKNIIARHKGVITKSSGINLIECSANSLDLGKLHNLKKELNIDNKTQIITMVVARAIWSKGVREFVEASELLKNKYSSTKFVLVGPVEENSPQAVPADYLNGIERTNFHWCSSFRHDIKELVSISDFITLPSYYREGVPKTLVEALAMGKPIVTTNNTGCKEVVEEGKNGYLVPIKNSKALARAIEKLLLDANKRKEFGKYSRVKAEREFDEKLVINRIINELYQLDL